MTVDPCLELRPHVVNVVGTNDSLIFRMYLVVLLAFVRADRVLTARSIVPANVVEMVSLLVGVRERSVSLLASIVRKVNTLRRARCEFYDRGLMRTEVSARSHRVGGGHGGSCP